MEITKKIYLEILKSVLGHSILHYCRKSLLFYMVQIKIGLKIEITNI